MLLKLIFNILLFGIFSIFFIPKSQFYILKCFTLFISGFSFFICILILFYFSSNFYYFQHILFVKNNFNVLNFSFFFGLDGISIYFFVLSGFLIFLCILFVWNEKLLKEYFILLLILEILLFLVFSVLDLFLFYLFFEAILIPVYLIIGIWGSRERKIRAAYLFFFYTLLSSLLMLICIIYLYVKLGTLNLEYLSLCELTFKEQCWLWLSMFFSFASKIPIFPFHVWLPEAHVEAPTIGSILLAGILLKLGVYGFLRFSLGLFPLASLYFSPLIYLCSLLGIIYGSLSAIRQTDFKRIIAYSSIAHMNLISLAIFSFTVLGLEGAIFQSISHGFVSGSLFLLVGCIYDRYHSRLLYYYGGLVHTMPVYSAFLLFFIMSNIALPGTSSFVGEFLLLCGIFKINTFVSIASTTGVVLAGIYSLWFYNRLVFGNLKIEYTLKFKDITTKEFLILFSFAVLVLILGIYSPTVFDVMHLSTYSISLINFF